MEYGYPNSIRSDGGPQFRSEFTEYRKNKRISHELASPYNPEPNGLAEAAIKNLKSLVIRCDEANEDLRQAIATWRNMVRTDGSSPAQMFFNRTQKQGLPLLNPNAKPFEPENLIKKRNKLHEQRIKLRDQHSVIIEDLAPGQEVLIQDYLSGLWKDSAVVLSKRDDSRSYWVRNNLGQSFIRVRRRLKAVSPSEDNPQATASNIIEISVSRISMAWQLNDRTLKAKLHRLPPSVVCSA